MSSSTLYLWDNGRFCLLPKYKKIYDKSWDNFFFHIETSFHSKGAFNLQIICGNFNQKDRLIWVHISFQTRWPIRLNILGLW